MRFLAFLVLFSAIAIASCAAYFSIIGLKLLFVGSGISIVVMGIALEVGKFITATFLKQKWNEIDLFLKAYLMAATIVLMAITSIGIYGYLSAGYNATAIKVTAIEQTIQANAKKREDLKLENIKLAQDPTNESDIQLINANKTKFIEQQIKFIEQKETRIKELRSNSNADKKSSDDLVAAKASLDADKATLDSEINKELEQIKLINGRLAILDEEVQNWLKQGNRGLFRENGADKARVVKQAQEKERADIDAQIKERQNKIQSLRDEYKVQQEKYNTRVTAIERRLIGQNNAIEQQIKELEKEIVTIRQGIDTYNANAEKALNDLVIKKEETIQDNKTRISQNETTIKDLLITEADLKEQIIRTDVGTFKFVAQSLGLTLDKTVTYFIGAIMLVFDPLAVCLILCFNHLIRDLPKKKKVTIEPTLEPEVISITTPLSSTTAPSTQEIQPMKSSEIIFGKPRVKHIPVEGEAKRLEQILEQQRKEKAERDAKKSK